MKQHLFFMGVFFFSIIPSLYAGDLLGIPLKPDPPFAMDGALGDWASVPNAYVMDVRENAVWGAAQWTGPADFNGWVKLAWRNDSLFIAAQVTDDQFRQTQAGSGIWKGDHIEIYVDTQPDTAKDNAPFGEETFQIALSPGNFQHTSDPLVDRIPEVFCFHPNQKAIPEAIVASTQTEQGWTLEAAIPWKFLGISAPTAGMALHVEAALSDTDSNEAQQETLLASSPARWEHVRSRLRSAVLAGSDGIPHEAAQATVIFKEARIEPGKKQSFEFDAPSTPEGKDAVLSFQARLDYEKVAGNCPTMTMTLNGKPVTGANFINRPTKAKSGSGQMHTLGGGETITIFYAPDFESADVDPHYGLKDSIRACYFDLNISTQLQPGKNTLEIAHTTTSIPNPLIIANATLQFRTPAPPPKPKAGPPTGPLPFFEPQPTATEFSVKELPNAQLELTIDGETFLIASQFSSPKPEWVHGSCAYFNHTRHIKSTPELVIVRDAFENLGDENLGIMQRHQINLKDRFKKLWLAGLEQGGATAAMNQPANPTTYAATDAHGIGLMPLSDAFRLHATNYAQNGIIGLADNLLVIPAKGKYTAEWAIIPTRQPDYFAFLNPARRLLDANFLIDGAFAFFRAGPLTDKWSDQQITDFLRFKDARYACSSIDYPLYNGWYPHGTAFQRITYDNYIGSFARWRKLVPDIKCLLYFHCFIDVTEDGPTRFADARTLQPDGNQATYGEAHDRLYFPTDKNSYGAAVAKNVDNILDVIGADGVYWDEHEYSRVSYQCGEPWDGCTGDIDPRTMRVTGLKSSITLLSESWRLALAKRILAHGPLIGNGPPFTRAMASLKFPCFVETGSITNCTQAHLHSPIALGDHLTERSERDAYGVMLGALDYGCVYHWYNDVTVIPTHPQLTRYMYPITPLELHEGYIIGKERIITRKSGCFGWGDASEHDVHVFDDTGTEISNFAAPLRHENGKTCTELRLPEDYAAAILRKSAQNHRAREMHPVQHENLKGVDQP